MRLNECSVGSIVEIRYEDGEYLKVKILGSPNDKGNVPCKVLMSSEDSGRQVGEKAYLKPEYQARTINLLIEDQDNISETSNENHRMSGVISFVKNLALGAEEKLLRKANFKDDCGNYTEQAREFAFLKLCEEKEADMVEVATAMEAEKKESKK